MEVDFQNQFKLKFTLGKEFFKLQAALLEQTSSINLGLWLVYGWFGL